jgi:hypothetical protein
MMEQNGHSRVGGAEAMKPCSLDEARAAKSHALKILRAVPGLAGVGVTRVGQGYGVKVNLASAPKRSLDLPSEIDGVPVRLEVVGRVRKRGARRPGQDSAE